MHASDTGDMKNDDGPVIRVMYYLYIYSRKHKKHQEHSIPKTAIILFHVWNDNSDSMYGIAAS